MSSFFRCFAPAVQVDRARWHIELWKVKSCTIGHCRRPIFGNGKEQRTWRNFVKLPLPSQHTNIYKHRAAICKAVDSSVAKDAMLGACRVRVPVRFRCFTSSRTVVKAEARKSMIVDLWDMVHLYWEAARIVFYIHRWFLHVSTVGHCKAHHFWRTLARFKQVRRTRMLKRNPKQFAPFLEQLGGSSLWLYPCRWVEWKVICKSSSKIYIAT